MKITRCVAYDAFLDLYYNPMLNNNPPEFLKKIQFFVDWSKNKIFSLLPCKLENIIFVIYFKQCGSMRRFPTPNRMLKSSPMAEIRVYVSGLLKSIVVVETKNMILSTIMKLLT